MFKRFYHETGFSSDSSPLSLHGSMIVSKDDSYNVLYKKYLYIAVLLVGQRLFKIKLICKYLSFSYIWHYVYVYHSWTVAGSHNPDMQRNIGFDRIVIANLFMEGFENKALDQASQKSRI